MITEKYPYQELKKKNIDGSRRYLTPDGGKLPSVTTILSATQSEEKKKGLQEWRKRVGYAKAQEITTEAAGRGTRMHKWLENYVLSDDGDMGQYGSNPYSKQSHIMAQEIIDKGLTDRLEEIWGVECTLYYPDKYAGTADCVGVYEGKETIIDFKQSNKPKKAEYIDSWMLQTSAYSLAHNIVYNSNITACVILVCTVDNLFQEFKIQGHDLVVYQNLFLGRLKKFNELSNLT